MGARKGITMGEAKAKCRHWRELGDAKSLRKAAKMEAKFREHPNYESDAAYLLRIQAGPP